MYSNGIFWDVLSDHVSKKTCEIWNYLSSIKMSFEYQTVQQLENLLPVEYLTSQVFGSLRYFLYAESRAVNYPKNLFFVAKL